MGSTVGHHCCCVERKCYDNRKNVCVGVPFKLVILFGDIFSRIFYFYQYGVHTHNEFFLGPTHHHTAIFFLRQRSLEGGPTCAGHMGSTLILFSCLFQTSSGSFIFSTDGGPVLWNMIISFSPPSRKIFILILKVEPGQVVVAGRGFDYFIFRLGFCVVSVS